MTSPQPNISVKNVKFGTAVMLNGKTVTSYNANISRKIHAHYDVGLSIYVFIQELDDGRVTKTFVHPTNVQWAELTLENDNETVHARESDDDSMGLNAEPARRGPGRPRTKTA